MHTFTISQQPCFIGYMRLRTQLMVATSHNYCTRADIVYMVTGGSSLHQAYKLFGGTQSFGLSAWIVVFAATELLSCQVSVLHLHSLCQLNPLCTGMHSVLPCSVPHACVPHLILHSFMAVCSASFATNVAAQLRQSVQSVSLHGTYAACSGLICSLPSPFSCHAAAQLQRPLPGVPTGSLHVHLLLHHRLGVSGGRR